MAGGQRASSPGGRRALSFEGFFGFSAMGGVGTSASWRRQARLFLNHAPPFAGRGRNSSIARISGEGHGTALVASSILAERRAPHPNPLPPNSGGAGADQPPRQPS